MKGIGDWARRAARRVTPAPVKRALGAARVRQQYYGLRDTIRRYHSDSTDDEIAEVLDYLNTSKLQMLPYRWTQEYKAEAIEVRRDSSGMVRATVGLASVYFPSALSESEVAASVANALAEQDPRSPHAYWCDDFDLRKDDVAVLVGASDGIFALRLVDRVARLYLFEADPAWISALERTMAPWRRKVVIVPKYVSDQDSESTVRLDTFFSSEERQPSYLQADVEGGELAVLSGARGILAGSERIAVSICSYHDQDDEAKLDCFLRELGLMTHTTRGYIISWGRLLSAPYLRRGVIHATK